MPRTARIDLPGLMYHVIARGIERRDIFLDDQDRQSFADRLSRQLQETGTECLAWALLPNHFHLLLRTRQGSLARFMRRLLTGHATVFNRRHRRVGHLFQNRYKSIVCEEEPYLLELVRYVHLNPLRAGVVADMDVLDRYPWSGHSVLMGFQSFTGQETDEVLLRFGRRYDADRVAYRAFVLDGIAQGHRDELAGGGQRRSGQGMEESDAEQAFDERVLRCGSFVEQLRRERGLMVCNRALTLSELARRVAAEFGVAPEALSMRKKSKPIAAARSVFCYFAARQMGVSGTEIGRILNIGRAGVSAAADKGEVLLIKDPNIRERLGRVV